MFVRSGSATLQIKQQAVQAGLWNKTPAFCSARCTSMTARASTSIRPPRNAALSSWRSQPMPPRHLPGWAGAAHPPRHDPGRPRGAEAGQGTFRPVSDGRGRQRAADQFQHVRTSRGLAAAILNWADGLDFMVFRGQWAEVWRRPALPEGRPRWGRSGRW